MLSSLPAAIAVLSAMITPAVLILATSSLIVATAGRLGRIVDRARKLADEFEELAMRAAAEDGENALLLDERSMLFDQLRSTTTRARYLQRAMMLLYLALGSFLATSIAIGLTAAFGRIAAWLPVALGMFGILILLNAAILLIMESRIALAAINAEMAFVRRVGEHYAPSQLRAAFAQRGAPRRLLRWW